jgi:hypothetical protein
MRGAGYSVRIPAYLCPGNPRDFLRKFGLDKFLFAQKKLFLLSKENFPQGQEVFLLVHKIYPLHCIAWKIYGSRTLWTCNKHVTTKRKFANSSRRIFRPQCPGAICMSARTYGASYHKMVEEVGELRTIFPYVTQKLVLLK